jgi:hypothetical protein
MTATTPPSSPLLRRSSKRDAHAARATNTTAARRMRPNSSPQHHDLHRHARPRGPCLFARLVADHKERHYYVPSFGNTNGEDENAKEMQETGGGE